MTGVLFGSFVMSNLFYQLDITNDPASAVVMRSFATPGAFPGGLAWDGRTLWHNDFGTELFYQIDPRDGTIIRSASSPGFNVRGMTHDGRTLWMSDINDDLIYQVALN